MQVKMGWARRAAVIGAAALLSAGLVACGSDDDKGSDAETTAAATTRTFQAQNGAIEIPGDPQSIVACGYAVLPLIQSGANLSGICEWGREDDNMDADTRKAYDDLPKVGPDGAISELNYEASPLRPGSDHSGCPSRAQSQVDMGKLQHSHPSCSSVPRRRPTGARSASSSRTPRTYPTRTVPSSSSTTNGPRRSRGSTRTSSVG